MRVFEEKGVRTVEITTRAPVRMHMHSKALSFALGLSLKAMYQQAAERFLKDKPWEHGLRWRPTKSLTATLGDTIGQKIATGWMQVNLRLKEETGKELQRIANQQGVSLSSVTYTLMYWWTWFIYPPKYERERREKLMQQRVG